MQFKRILQLIVLLAVGGIPAVAWAQEAPDFGELVHFIRWGGVFFSFVVVIASALVLRIVSEIGSRLGNRFTSHRLLVQKFESFAQFAIYLGAAGICLGLSIRLDKTAMAVVGGALAFSIGFAMRDLVAAFIAGVTIMFDRPFQVGDRVEYAGQYGDIIKIGLRSVRMNTLDDHVVTIPNNKILTDVTASGNYGCLEMQVPMDFYIGADQDLSVATRIIHEACLTSRYCYLDRNVPIEAKQVILENYVAFQLKARPCVLDVKYEKDFETDVHSRVQLAFAEAKIGPPAVIHRTL